MRLITAQKSFSFWATIVVLLLVACGGGSSETTPEQAEGVGLESVAEGITPVPSQELPPLDLQQPTGEEPVPPNSQVQLVCSAECSVRGACGTVSDGSQVVLANRDEPMTFPERQNVSFPAGLSVSVLETRNLTLEPLAGGARFEHPFHLVVSSELGKAGWVAGWCVATP